MMMRRLLYQLSPTSKTLESVLALDTAIKLAHLGARTHTIISLTKLSERKVKEIIKDVTGKSPVPGRVAKSLEGYVRNKQHRLQISVLISNYLKGLRLGLNETDSLIQSYADYKNRYIHLLGTRLFIEMDYAHQLVRAVTIFKTHSLVKCGTCHGFIFRDNSELYDETDCPICTMTEHKSNSMGHSAYPKFPSAVGMPQKITA